MSLACSQLRLLHQNWVLVFALHNRPLKGLNFKRRFDCLGVFLDERRAELRAVYVQAMRFPSIVLVGSVDSSWADARSPPLTTAWSQHLEVLLGLLQICSAYAVRIKAGMGRFQ